MINYDYFLVRGERMGENITLRGTFLCWEQTLKENGQAKLKESLDSWFGTYSFLSPKLLYRINPDNKETVESKVNEILHQGNLETNLKEIERSFSRLPELTQVQFDEPYTRFKITRD